MCTDYTKIRLAVLLDLGNTIITDTKFLMKGVTRKSTKPPQLRENDYFRAQHFCSNIFNISGKYYIFIKLY